MDLSVFIMSCKQLTLPLKLCVICNSQLQLLIDRDKYYVFQLPSSSTVFVITRVHHPLRVSNHVYVTQPRALKYYSTRLRLVYCTTTSFTPFLLLLNLTALFLRSTAFSRWSPLFVCTKPQQPSAVALPKLQYIFNFVLFSPQTFPQLPHPPERERNTFHRNRFPQDAYSTSNNANHRNFNNTQQRNG